MPPEGFFAGMEWRMSPVPFALEPGEWAVVEKLGIYLAKFQKAANLLYRQSVKGTAPSWIAEWCDRGKPEEVIALGREGARADALPSLIRPDLILTDEGPVLTEIDSVPGGSGLTAWMQELYGQNGQTDNDTGNLVGTPEMKLRLRQYFREHDIVVSEEASDYGPELRWLYGNEAVFPAETYRFNGKPVYRFFEGFDWPQLNSLRESHSESQAMDAPLKAFLDEKLWLGLFWLKPLESFWRQELGGRYFRELRKIIPYTWIIEPETLPPMAVIPHLGLHSWDELKEYSQRDRDLVLKISGYSPLAWGSRGVHIGSDMSGDEWAAAVQMALDSAPQHPYILQPFRKGRLVKHPYFEGKDGHETEMEGRVRLCPYYLSDGKNVECLGAQATICPADKKRIHGMSDAIIVPVARKLTSSA